MEHLFTRETEKGKSKKVKGKSEAATAFNKKLDSPHFCL
jgi:hypothetical protein